MPTAQCPGTAGRMVEHPKSKSTGGFTKQMCHAIQNDWLDHIINEVWRAFTWHTVRVRSHSIFQNRKAWSVSKKTKKDAIVAPPPTKTGREVKSHKRRRGRGVLLHNFQRWHGIPMLKQWTLEEGPLVRWNLISAFSISGIPTNVSCQLFVASLSSINTEDMVSVCLLWAWNFRLFMFHISMFGAQKSIWVTHYTLSVVARGMKCH